MINSSYAYAETLDVLQNMNNIYVDQIPEKFIEMLKSKASKDYEKHINVNVDLKNQNLSKETINILAVINYKYWVKDEEHRKQLLDKYRQNEEKYQKEIEEKYNPDMIFKNDKNDFKIEEVKKTNTIALKKQKETVFGKLIKKIKIFFGVD